LLKIDLDSNKKSIYLEVMLEGEVEPLEISIDKYQLIQEGDKYLLKVYSFNTSRAWINTVISKYLKKREFEIPKEYANMLKILV